MKGGGAGRDRLCDLLPQQDPLAHGNDGLAGRIRPQRQRQDQLFYRRQKLDGLAPGKTFMIVGIDAAFECTRHSFTSILINILIIYRNRENLNRFPRKSGAEVVNFPVSAGPRPGGGPFGA